MRYVLVLALLSGSAFADRKPAPAPAPAKTAPAKAKPCKKVIVNKKAVCEVTAEAELTVNAAAPKPNVVIIPRDGKNVTGRPKSDDRLKGLSPRL